MLNIMVYHSIDRLQAITMGLYHHIVMNSNQDEVTGLVALENLAESLVPVEAATDFLFIRKYGIVNTINGIECRDQRLPVTLRQ